MVASGQSSSKETHPSPCTISGGKEEYFGKLSQGSKTNHKIFLNRPQFQTEDQRRSNINEIQHLILVLMLSEFPEP